MKSKLLSVFLIVWVLLAMPMTAFAQDFDSDSLGSISVTLKDPDDKTPITGAEFSIYRVATVSLNNKNNLSYTFTETFENCGSALDDKDLSQKLEAFIKNNSVSAKKLVTDTKGEAKFEDLPLGLYFVQQTNSVDGYAPCTSFIVTVPSKSDDGFDYDVDASPKTDIEKRCSITIKKTWNTDSYAKIPDSITVELLRDDTVVETATLSSGNNWQTTYTDMPESDSYSIKEVNVPAGFTATYSQNGYVFTVTNSSSLAQTGQLIWPIPVLAMAGLCLVGLGSIILRKAGKKNA